ncbi:MAG: RrF2 family transcriptional regulator [Acidimicrobiia bacterium]
MHLQLGKRADYSVRAILHLAMHWDSPGRQKARVIAEAMDIPDKYLPQVLAALARVGLVSSEPGPDGGYRLATDPASLTLLDVIEAVEGPIVSVECVLRGGPCHWRDRCAVHETWSQAQDALRARLDRTTFADLAAVEASLTAEG